MDRFYVLGSDWFKWVEMGRDSGALIGGEKRRDFVLRAFSSSATSWLCAVVLRRPFVALAASPHRVCTPLVFRGCVREGDVAMGRHCFSVAVQHCHRGAFLCGFGSYVELAAM